MMVHMKGIKQTENKVIIQVNCRSIENSTVEFGEDMDHRMHGESMKESREKSWEIRAKTQAEASHAFLTIHV